MLRVVTGDYRLEWDIQGCLVGAYEYIGDEAASRSDLFLRLNEAVRSLLERDRGFSRQEFVALSNYFTFQVNTVAKNLFGVPLYFKYEQLGGDRHFFIYFPYSKIGQIESSPQYQSSEFPFLPENFEEKYSHLHERVFRENKPKCWPNGFDEMDYTFDKGEQTFYIGNQKLIIQENGADYCIADQYTQESDLEWRGVEIPASAIWFPF